MTRSTYPGYFRRRAAKTRDTYMALAELTGIERPWATARDIEEYLETARVNYFPALEELKSQGLVENDGDLWRIK